jgi:2-polyprenyl-3-methyl-5-hydroxy-6-metoxy-1,4-benzoquinol methylase
LQDSQFYNSSRFVTHIDDHAIDALTQYYGTLINSEKRSILDLCGSWISHLPLPLPLGTDVMGIGMNEEELAKNEAYTEWKVYDLNDSEKQQWIWLNSESLDIVICTVSIDYLIYPLTVLKECFRLLKHGTPKLWAN